MMKLKFLVLAAIFVFNYTNAQEVTKTMNPPVMSKELLTAMFASRKPVSRAEIREVTMEPGVKAHLHLHPCPTMGVISEGAISFQIEGQPVQHLKVGDAFYEPEDVRVAKFDNDGNVPAKFVTFYMLGEKEQKTIRILDK